MAAEHDEEARSAGEARDEPVPLRALLALAWPERWLLAAALLCLALASAAALAWPLGVRTLIDDTLLGAGRPGALGVDELTLVLLALFLGQSIAGALRFYLFTIAGERIVLRLRRRLFGALVRREIAFFDQRRTGELMSRLSADSTAVQGVLTSDLSYALRNLLLCAGGIALLAWTSGQLALTMLLVVPPVTLGAVFFGGRIRRISKAAHDALAEAGHVAEETLGGIRTVRAFAREEREERRYLSAVEQSFRLFRRRALTVAGFFGVASFAGFGSIAAVLWAGARMVAAEELSIGELSSFLLYTLTVAMAITGLGETWTELSRARGASERVFQLLGEEGGEHAPSTRAGADRGAARRIPAAAAPAAAARLSAPAPPPMELRGELAFERVGFHYPARPDVRVLEEVSFELRPGELLALVGPSGAGKSTIAALALGFYAPDEGRVLVDGRDLSELDARAFRARVGYVPQEPQLFSTSIAENVRYGREDASEAELEAALRAANALEFVTGLPEGSATQVGERGVRISAGQKQRLAIARALLLDPRILVLDEPTSALDAESEHQVKEALARLLRGRAALVIAHRLSTVRRATSVLVLRAGRVVERGSHAELIERGGLYRELAERQLAPL